MAINNEQRAVILTLIKQGSLSSEQIAQEAGVSLGSVAAVRANLSRGAYKDSAVDSAIEVAEEAEEIVFTLEKDMQTALRANIQQLEAKLTIADGGSERKTAAGLIDITAKDASGKTVVIELKAGTAAPDALTQVMAYVGAVAEEEGKTPRAMLIAQDFHKKVIFAAMAIPGLKLLRYGFTFTFTPEQQG